MISKISALLIPDIERNDTCRHVHIRNIRKYQILKKIFNGRLSEISKIFPKKRVFYTWAKSETEQIWAGLYWTIWENQNTQTCIRTYVYKCVQKKLHISVRQNVPIDWKHKTYKYNRTHVGTYICTGQRVKNISISEQGVKKVRYKELSIIDVKPRTYMYIRAYQ